MREIEDQARFYAHTGVVSGRFSVTQAPMVSVNVCRPLRLLGSLVARCCSAIQSVSTWRSRGRAVTLAEFLLARVADQEAEARVDSAVDAHPRLALRDPSPGGVRGQAAHH